MKEFFSDEQIAASKAEWEPQLRSFAHSTNATLGNSRRLPIYEQAIVRAKEWLDDVVARRLHLRPSETLIITGDEHLYAAASRAALPTGSIFLYRPAWRYWWSSVLLDRAPWWQVISWVINCPESMIELAYPHDFHLQLTPNLTYLRSEAVADRGTHSILHVVDGSLVTKQVFSEWVDS